jgi:hypothetical protein
MQWHYEKLANDGQKPLSSLAGYEAMTTSLLEHKRDYIVLIMIPPLSKDEEVNFLSFICKKQQPYMLFLGLGYRRRGLCCETV